MKKFIRVTMSNGEKWRVPLKKIVEHKAVECELSFEEQDKLEDYFDEFPDEAIDWAENNILWSEISKHATREESPDVIDYQDEWDNGEKKVVEI